MFLDVPTFPRNSVGTNVGTLTMGTLTALAVKAATKAGRYQDGDGLILVVKESGARSWQVRVQADGKRRDFGLGGAKTTSLSEAREKAAEIRKLYKGGVDPVATAKAAKLATQTLPTFAQAAEMAHGEQERAWRNPKHRKDWLSSMKVYAFPEIGNVRIDHLTAPMVRDVLLPIWLEKPETARRVRQRVRAVMDWAASKGYCNGLDLSGLAKGLPRQPKQNNHFAAMPYEAVPAFTAKIRNADETIGRLALQFTILTAARSGETRRAIWPEIDLEAKLWTIPAGRMKAGREHVVPLSKAAIAILERVVIMRQDDDAPVFQGKSGKPLSDMTLSKILRDMGEPFTVHGFRSSFKDWASECTSFPDAVSESALAHQDTNKVRASYRRTDFLKMRADLMEAWRGYLDGQSATVVAMPERKSNAA